MLFFSLKIAPKRWRLEINFSQGAVLMLSSVNLPDGVQVCYSASKVQSTLSSDILNTVATDKLFNLLVCWKEGILPLLSRCVVAILF
jgi:hypothetical protein